MRVSTLIPTIILNVVASAGPLIPRDDILSLDPINQSDMENLDACTAKNPTLPPLIDTFCSNPSITVPSSYTSTGAADVDHKYNITIQNYACNGQWVPSHWCRVQFWETCAGGDGEGVGQKLFGYGTGPYPCQMFSVQKWEAPRPCVDDKGWSAKAC